MKCFWCCVFATSECTFWCVYLVLTVRLFVCVPMLWCAAHVHDRWIRCLVGVCFMIHRCGIPVRNALLRNAVLLSPFRLAYLSRCAVSSLSGDKGVGL